MEYGARAVQDIAELTEIADRLLQEGGIHHPPVPENLVALCDPGRATIIAQRPIGLIRAVLQPDDGGWLIIVNNKLPRAAQRFSIFHEAYHILYRCGAFVPMSNGNTPEEYHEWLADQFAARVLMPRRWVLEIAPKTSSQQLCGIFHVSQTAMGKRLKELGI